MSNEDFNCNTSVEAAEQSQQDAQDTIVIDADDDSDNNTSTIDTSIMDKVKSRVSGILPNSFSKWFSSNSKNTLELDNNNETPQSHRGRRRQRIELEEDDDGDNDAGVHDNDYDEENADVVGSAASGRVVSVRNENNNHKNDMISNISLNVEEHEIHENDATTTATSKRVNFKKFNSKGPLPKRLRLNDQLENTSINPLEERMPLLASTPAVDNNNIMLQRNSKRPPLLMGKTIPNRSKFLNLYGHQQNVREPGYDFQVGENANERYADNISNSLRDRVNSLESTNLGTIPQPSVVVKSRAGILDLKRKQLDSFNAEQSQTQNRCNASRSRRSPAISTVIIEDNENEEERSMCEEEHKRATRYNGDRGDGVAVTSRNDIDDADYVVSNGGEDSGNERQSECDDDAGARGDSLSGRHSARNMSRTSSFGNGLNFYSHLEGRKSLFSNLNEPNQNKPITGNLSLNNSTLSLTSLNRRKFNASIYGSTSALSDSRLLNINSPFYKGNTTFGGAASYSRYNYKKFGNNISNSSHNLSTMRTLPTQIRPTSSLSSLSSSLSAAATATAVAANATSSGNPAFCKDGGDNMSNISNTAKRILDLINDFTTPLNEAKKMASNSRALNYSQQQKSKLGGVRRLNDSDIQNTRAMRLSRVQKPYMRAAVTLQPNNNKDKINGKIIPPVRELQVPSMSQIMQMKKLQNTTERSRQLTNNISTTISIPQQQQQHQQQFELSTNNYNESQQLKSSMHYNLPTETTINKSIFCKLPQQQQEQPQKQEQPQQQQQQQQKHTGKMRNKICASVRSTGSKSAQQMNDDYDEMPPVNLPNIAFPLMKSMPKFDIEMSYVSTNAATGIITTTPINKSSPMKNFLAAPINAITIEGNSLCKSNAITTTTIKTVPTTTFSFMTKTNTTISANTTTASNSMDANKEFVFSTPQQLNAAKTIDNSNLSNLNKNQYKFSAPTLLNTTNGNTTTAAAASTIIKTNDMTSSQQKQPSVDNFIKAQKESLNKTTTRTETTTTTEVADIWSMAKIKNSSDWECDACMLRNKPDLVKCVACETPRKYKKTTTTTTDDSAALGSTLVNNNNNDKLTATTSTFGTAFKRKLDTWECPTCMITNKNDDVKCVACQTDCPKRTIAGVPAKIASVEGLTPTSKAPAAFQFGISTKNATPTTTSINNNDNLFKSLVTAQKSSKWECDACMTRNEITRSKCVCCEQARPGATETSTDQSSASTGPKFVFGQTATAKFSFGFGANDTAANTTANTTTIPVSTTTSSTFSFGLNKNVADSKTSSSATTTPAAQFVGFKFGVTTTSSTTTNNNNNNKTSTSVSSTSTITTTTTTSTVASSASLPTAGFVFGQKSTATTLPSVKFNLPTSNSSGVTSSSDAQQLNSKTSITSGTTTTTSMANSTKISTGGFSFGNINNNNTNVSTTDSNNKNNTSTIAFGTAVSSTSGTFSFDTSGGITSSASKSETTTLSPANKNLFNMASPKTSTLGGATPAAGTTSTTTASINNNKLTFGTNVSSSSTNIFGSFAANNNLQNTTTATTTTANSLAAATNFPSSVSSSFGSPVTTTTTTSNAFALPSATTSSTTTPNIFGSFKANTIATTTTSINNNAQTTSLFGNALKPIVAAAAASASPAAGATNTAQFVFGQASTNNSNNNNNNNNNSNAAVVAAVSSSTTTTNASWPKNNFVFGGNATTQQVTSNNSSTVAASDATASKSLFGGFGAAANASNSGASGTMSLFGNPAATATPATNNNTGAISFGGLSAATKPNFGAGSTNIFSNSMAAPSVPTFGSKAFGSDATPTFGSAASEAKVGRFGAFGGNNSNINNANTNLIAEPKKTESPMFNFGSTASSAPQNNVFGGNVGAAVKPAFNFTTVNQPAFNFTATSDQQQQQSAVPVAPFQFGAASAAPPVYNFSAGNAEQTNAAPSAPFQFNATGISTATNMFAPNPTAGIQSAQQARRKIRTPVRRLPPR